MKLLLRRVFSSGNGQDLGESDNRALSGASSRHSSLQLRLRLLEHVVDSSPASVVITDAKGGIEYVNQHFSRVTGYSSDDVLGKNPRLLKSGRQSRQFYHELWTTILSGREWFGEFENRKRNGETFWEKAYISPIRDDHGRITHFVAIKQDITDSKRNESYLTWLAALVENSTDVCVISNCSHCVLAANSAYARLLGFASPYELANRSIHDIIKTNAEDEPLRSILAAEQAAQSLPPGGMLTRELTYPHQTSDPHIYFARFFPIHDIRGKLIATACIATDVSEQKKIENDLIRAKEEAEAANRAKSAFLATMSHELRTPLNVINSVTSTLLEKDISLDQRHALQLVMEGGQSLLGIIEEILEYSGLQAGKIRLIHQPFPVLPTVMQALHFAQSSARKKNISLSYWMDPRTPSFCVGDGPRLRQVLVNLLHNAVKFTERGRVHLSISVHEKQGVQWLRFSIMDTGIGMDAPTQKRIFQPFTQADASIKRRFGGTGLGLVISQNYAVLMGGRISVRSRVGHGSIFSFQIPSRGQTETAKVFSEFSHAVMDGKRILICVKRGPQRRLLAGMSQVWGISFIALAPAIPSNFTLRSAQGFDAIVIDQDFEGIVKSDFEQWARSSGISPTTPIIRVATAIPDTVTPADITLLNPLISPADFACALLSHWLPNSAHNFASAVAADSETQTPRLGDTLPLSILAADDIKTNREAIRLICEHLGYGIRLAENGAEVLALLPHGKFDLVILDMQMPILDGLSTAREIRRRYPDNATRPKMVALTANALAGDAEQCLEAGMDAYLSKPVVPKQLADVILRLFRPSASSGSQNPASPPSTAPKVQPWIDETHLQAITAGIDRATAKSLIQQLFDTFKDDYAQVRPTLIQACADKKAPILIDVVHGLKGGALMLGWARMGHSCVVFLAALRDGSFTQWEDFPDEIERLFDQSSSAMTRWLDTDVLITSKTN